ncbi:hypothetical protein ABEW24_17890 [Paenibacillus jamilae]|uniref:hypothetical protein n=1 Tax=Paenibacillus TaxID=44249 RepID=UPI000472ADFE|nr:MULTISPECIES: hypothetical protein [Paenibacillus]RFT92325.1 hypothetical protein DX902_24305 [Paenibacillus jamilae]
MSDTQLLRGSFLDFYEPYFSNRQTAQSFIESCYARENPLPRRILNYTERLIRLGEEAGEGRGGHGIQVTHFVICIESLFHLLNPDENVESVNRLGRIKYFFEEYTSKQDKNLLRKGVARSIADSRGLDGSLDMEHIARIFCEVRNKYIHEGVFYEFSFPTDEKEMDEEGVSYEVSLLNDLVLKEYRKDSKERRLYRITITYREIRDIMVRSCLCFLDKQIKILDQTP